MNTNYKKKKRVCSKYNINGWFKKNASRSKNFKIILSRTFLRILLKGINEFCLKFSRIFVDKFFASNKRSTQWKHFNRQSG